MNTKLLLTIVISAALPVLSVCTWTKHHDDAEKTKRCGDKTLLPIPATFFWVTLLGCVVFGVFGVMEFCKSGLNVFHVFQLFCFWMTMFSSRFFICYNGDSLLQRSAFGRVKEFSYAQIHVFTNILMDGFLFVGHRLCLLDFRQGWTELEDSYRRWRRENGIDRREHKPKSGLGKTLALNRFGRPAFIFYELLFFGGGIGIAALAIGSIVQGELDIYVILCLALGLGGIAFGILNIVCLSDPVRHRKLLKKLWKDSIFDPSSNRNR